MNNLKTTDDGLARCWWGTESADYVIYHDVEWGRAVTDRARLFEKLCLEGFQSGLSWITILRKRDNFRRAFADFDPERMAEFDEGDVLALLEDAGIVRHQGKIRAVINNARRLPLLEAEVGPFPHWLWSEWSERRLDPPADIPPTTVQSTALSRRLKKAGFAFVGPTTVYAFMQAMGLVNDHIRGCHVRDDCQAERLAVFNSL
jgi:DNA-3-methyladenine glycosylase I